MTDDAVVIIRTPLNNVLILIKDADVDKLHEKPQCAIFERGNNRVSDIQETKQFLIKEQATSSDLKFFCERFAVWL